MSKRVRGVLAGDPIPVDLEEEGEGYGFVERRAPSAGIVVTKRGFISRDEILAALEEAGYFAPAVPVEVKVEEPARPRSTPRKGKRRG